MVSDTPYLQKNFSHLKDGNTLTMARQLRSLLVEMFRNHQLLITSEILVYFRICEQQNPARVPARVPFSWKQEVNGVKINMAEIGAHGDNFVVWGPKIVFGETELYQPYIILAGLGGSVSIKTLLKKKLLGKILGFLKMWVLDRKTFKQEKSFSKLQGDLDELAHPVDVVPVQHNITPERRSVTS